MSVQELKSLLISRINRAEDEAGLTLLAEVVDQVLHPVPPSHPGLSKAEFESAIRGRAQIATGLTSTHAEMRQTVLDAIRKVKAA